MESLNILEKKVVAILELVKAKDEKIMELMSTNEALVQEKQQLSEALELLENSVLKGSQNMEEFNQEREITKMVVDGLINSIDKIVEQTQQ